jgi:hypothetical protein
MKLSAKTVLLVGDPHADTGWFEFYVLPAAQALGVGAVLVLGDFGYWRDAMKFIKLVNNAREKFGVDVWFIPGNHEEYPFLEAEVEDCRRDGADPLEPVQLGHSLFYIPRGGRVSVGGLEVATLGGAVSIDRYWRTPYVDWFEEEAITNEDVANLISGGPADVLLSHDTVSGYWVPGLRPTEALDPLWQRQVPASDANRAMLRRGYEGVEPKLLVHGHYHIAYEKTLEEPWGSVRAVGLDCNGTTEWGRVLSAQNGQPVLGDWVIWPPKETDDQNFLEAYQEVVASGVVEAEA